MTAYAIAHLHNTEPHPEVVEYIERIQGTLDPYGGRFLVHGTQHEVKEGNWDGAVVVIAFPGIDKARDWWDSPTPGVGGNPVASAGPQPPSWAGERWT